MTSEFRPNPLTAAIVGAGVVGEYHIKAQQHAGSEIVIFEPDQARAEDVSKRFGGLAIARSLEEAIDKADVTHICTPHKLHAAGAIASIERETPVIIEKPLTVDLGEAIDIYKAARQHDVPTMVGTSFRLTPPFVEMYERLHEGDIGELVSLETTYLHDMGRVKAGNDWRSSPDRGSFLYGGGAHAVDLNMWMARQPLSSVQATISPKKVRPSYPGDEDFSLSLAYEDGTTGRVWVSAAAPLPQHGSDLKVYGTKGAMRAHNKQPHLETYKDGDAGWSSEDMGLSPTINEMSIIFNALVRGERTDMGRMPDIKEGLQVMIALDSLERAAETGLVQKVLTVDGLVG